MKNLVICCDGTWNTSDQHDNGVPDPTNVVRLYNAIAEVDTLGVSQYKYYHPGVGTSGSRWDKAIAGGTGKGLDRNIMSAYRDLCDHYERGDRIYLFGFSRGAYTVRSVAGLVSCCGLLDIQGLKETDAWQRIEQLFQRGYRRKSERREAWEVQGWKFQNDADKKVPIRFVGVWDTVGALGIPDDMALLNLIDNLHDYTFHDTQLSATVQTARHAIAMDEMRASFQPTLWTGSHPDAEQRWFSCVHADVGGGYPEIGLSDGPLKWMIDEAGHCDLAFNPSIVKQIQPNPRGVLHDSCQGAFALLPMQPRSVPQLGVDKSIDVSALNRQLDPPIHQCPYRQARPFSQPTPLTLDIFAAQQWNATGVWLEAGRTYRFTAAGEWLDSSIKCGPGGADDGHFQLSEVAQMAGSMLGQIEELFTKITDNKSAQFRFTKRHEDMPWFCLVGTIANGGGADAKGYIEPHESFRIGDGCNYNPRKSGYFYAYANDAWNCYGNNRGRVTLTIK